MGEYFILKNVGDRSGPGVIVKPGVAKRPLGACNVHARAAAGGARPIFKVAPTVPK